MDRCPCGRPLHYSTPQLQAMVEAFVRDLGPEVIVTVGDRRWRVSRHYIALHGLKASELPTLGFPELLDDPTRPPW
jgi:hypothetical protein